MCPGVDSVSKNEYQDTPGGKVGLCVRVFDLRIPKDLLRLVAGKFYLYLYLLELIPNTVYLVIFK
jgi:hypothetical protein